LGDGTTLIRTSPVQVIGLCQLHTSVNLITEPAGITTFPNPVKDEFTIEGTKETGVLLIFDINGKEIMRQSTSNGKSKVNIENLMAGFYLLTYHEAEKTANFKLVKY
jgi:hypothetical protein